ncbi:MAG: hypothetical protein R3330_03435, partial [Saprospiraceae bacterium]|nr:hypothetical protein [Saprospiraceae bacterium]
QVAACGVLVDAAGCYLDKQLVAGGGFLSSAKCEHHDIPDSCPYSLVCALLLDVEYRAGD